MAYRRPYKENVKLQFVMKLVTELVMVIAIAYLIVIYTCERSIVVGNSMNDVFKDGQTVLINKVAYLYDEPARYDIIYFKAQGIDSSRTYIKRIIGLPGETVQIVAGKVLINGSVLVDDVGEDIILSPGMADSAITLLDDEYFVLGDNRNNSEDSRFAVIGNVKASNIIGRPWVIMKPLDEFNLISRNYRIPVEEDDENDKERSNENTQETTDENTEAQSES